jgi:GntR family transcriptional regulator
VIQQRKTPRLFVADQLKLRIITGEFAPGALLPTVREIAADYRVAVNTAHESLRILATEGLIVLRPRKGALVAWPQKSVSGPHERLERSAKGAGLFRPSEVPEMLRVQLVTEVPPDASEAFGLPEDAQLGLREYLVRSGATVVTHGASYIHPEIWSQVPELREREPIADGIIGAVQRTLGRATAAVPPRRKADHATSEEAGYLGIAEDAPVLVEMIESVDGDGALVEWNLSVHPRNHWVGA